MRSKGRLRSNEGWLRLRCNECRLWFRSNKGRLRLRSSEGRLWLRSHKCRLWWIHRCRSLNRSRSCRFNGRLVRLVRLVLHALRVLLLGHLGRLELVSGRVRGIHLLLLLLLLLLGIEVVLHWLYFPVGKVLPVVGPHDLRRGNAPDFGFQLNLLADAGHHVGEGGAEAGIFRRF